MRRRCWQTRGKKGGKARAAALTEAQRQKIARKGVGAGEKHDGGGTVRGGEESGARPLGERELVKIRQTAVDALLVN